MGIFFEAQTNWKASQHRIAAIPLTSLSKAEGIEKRLPRNGELTLADPFSPLIHRVIEFSFHLSRSIALCGRRRNVNFAIAITSSDILTMK
jgi:hypothetical protein